MNYKSSILYLTLLLSSVSCLQLLGQGKSNAGIKVGLDYHFNNEWKKDANGKPYRFHYTWEDTRDSGFSMWDSAFTSLGAETVSIETAPTASNLKGLNVYIIVDPDTKKETESPNFVGQSDIKAITDWVKGGGVLVLMANDSGNAELDHFNLLAAQFGVQFNKDLKNPVIGKQYEMGKIVIPKDNEILKGVNQIYIKEYASLSIKAPAKAALKHNNDVVMATSKLGKGIVFVVGDPWLYNEYSNSSRLSSDYQNYLAGQALAKWLISQSKGIKK